MNVYAEAAALIREHGWWQGQDGEGPELCIGLAVDQACADAGTGSAPLIDLAERVTGTGNVNKLYQWNDAPERTVDEVLAVLDELAEAAA